MGQETLGEVRDVSWDPRGDPGLVGRPMFRSGTGQGSLVEVRDRSGGSLEVWDGSVDTRGFLGRFGGQL